VRVRGRYAAWPALAVVLAVGACSGVDDPPPSSSTSSGSSSSSSTPTTTTSSPSTTATATVKVPAAAQKHTPEGAAAFVKFYIDQSNDAWTKPDDSLLPPLSDKGCLSCQALQKTATNLVAKKQKYRTSPMTITKLGAVGGAPTGQQYVRVLGTQNRVDVIDSKGTVVMTDPKQSVALTASAVWKEGRWFIYDMG
jgi:hypothetical protein